jgi:vancomycin permeability regulator SanA
MKRAASSRATAATPGKGDRPTARLTIPDRTATKPRRRSPQGELWRWVVMLLVFAVVAAGLLGTSLVAAIYWQARADQGRPVDAIVVLGTAQYDGRPAPVLQARLDATLVAWEQGWATHIVVTGGRAEGDRYTEAEASATYLIDRGVPESAIVYENAGRTTAESLAAVGEIFDLEGWRTALFVSDGFHLLRVKMIGREAGIVGYGFAATTSPIRTWSAGEFFYVLREAAGITFFWWEHR